ncbi:S9 family peptidase [Longispora urticae]
MSNAAFDGLTSSGEHLFWLQSDDDGTSLMSWSEDEGAARLTPPGFEVGNAVHAYGGGSFAVAPEGVWCVAAEDGRVHLVPLNGAAGRPVPLGDGRTGGFGDLALRTGDLFRVREALVGDKITAVDTSTGVERILVRSSGFLAAPSPAPGKLAWLSWGVDQMPWDSTELWLASYERGGLPKDQVLVAGGPEESVVEPRWAPDGSLYFMSDRSGWLNLYRWDGTHSHPVAPMAAECAAAPWELGYSSYAFLPDGTVAMIVRNEMRDQLTLVSPSGQVRALNLPYTSIKPYLAAFGDRVAMIAATPTTAPAVVLVDMDGAQEVIAGQPPQRSDFPMPRALVAEGIHFLLHPPVEAESTRPAPLIVRAHPGPTDGVTFRRDPQIDFFTRHGFAVADVDYRGSTGYGRAFRQALYGRWGLDDVTDCRTVAEHLLATGQAVAGEVFICGASAGGYTALHAACHDGPFAAAAARSPIIDPKRWETTVPRFQRAHAAALDGGAGPVRAQVVHVPVLLIHGAADPITSASDTLDLARDLQDRQARYELLLLDTASHTLSAPTLTSAALEAELRFFQSVIDSGR